MRFRTGALSALLVSALAIATHAEAQRRPIRDRARDGVGRRGDAQTAQNRQSVQVGGRNRTYLLRVPQTVARGTPLPLVIVLHGGGGNADNAELMTGFSALVDREELIVAYPDGSGRQGRNMLLTWNAGHCCAYAMQNNVDDVAFIDALITQVARTYSVDPQRIYVTGMSNGAMMSHRLGRELSHRIAAIAPVVGAVFGDEAVASSPVSAIMINGLKDESVPPNGGPPGGLAKSQWDGTHPLPNVDQGNFWARSNGCNTTPSSSEQRQVIAWRWSCPAGVAVEVHQLRNGGHAWPGGKAGSKRGDRPSNVMDATETIWAFFKAHPKQTR